MAGRYVLSEESLISRDCGSNADHTDLKEKIGGERNQEKSEEATIVKIW